MPEFLGWRIGAFGYVTLIFIILQVSGIIDWDWLWVLSPLWLLGGAFEIFIFCSGLFMERINFNLGYMDLDDFLDDEDDEEDNGDE